MTTYNPPQKNVEYIFPLTLISQATGQIQSNPTIAASDFKISTDFGTIGNLATTPTVVPGSTQQVKVTVSAAEMNGNNVLIIASDAVGAQWDDVSIMIQPTDLITSDGLIKADSLALNGGLLSGNNATVKLKQLDVQTETGPAIHVVSQTGNGIIIQGTTALNIYGVGNSGLFIGSDTQAAVVISTDAADKDGMSILGLGTGKSINAPNDIAVSDGDLTLAAIASAVWANATRTLTSFGTLISDIWSAVTRTITGGTIDTNNDKTDYALTTSYDPAKTAAQAGDAMTLTAGERGAVADKFLIRNLAGGSDGGRNVQQALRMLRNLRQIVSGVLTVMREDDATPDWTANVTQTPGDPVSKIDPD